jgi:hypothetical protein
LPEERWLVSPVTGSGAFVVSAGRGSDLAFCVADRTGSVIAAIKTTAETNPYLRRLFNAAEV